jgi:phosphotriesterase-related protein
MSNIKTISGVIPSQKLGFCQCHEHLMISKGVSYDVNPALCIDSIEKSKQELLRYRAAGGQSVIDAQPVGCNRMESALGVLAEETGVNIICSTGFHKLYFYPEHHWIHTYSGEKLTEIYIHEIVSGMFVGSDTFEPRDFCSCKAGIIKTALDKEGLTDRYQRLFLAAIDAAISTGAPMMVHIEQGSDPLQLLKYLTLRGVPADKLIFCHLDRACDDDVDTIKRIVDKGVFAELDTIGRFKYHSDKREIEIIKELLDGGYQDQILCSLDTTRERLRAYNNDAVGLDYILKIFIPLMRNSGISEEQIHRFFYENCISALAF